MWVADAKKCFLKHGLYTKCHDRMFGLEKNIAYPKSMKNSKLLLIGGGAGVALLIVVNRWDKIQGNKDFQEGYAAGFLTPGPFTILALAGLVAWNV